MGQLLVLVGVALPRRMPVVGIGDLTPATPTTSDSDGTYRHGPVAWRAGRPGERQGSGNGRGRQSAKPDVQTSGVNPRVFAVPIPMESWRGSSDDREDLVGC